MSDYLNEEEQIARMKSWWDENGSTVIISIVVAVVAIAGWQWYGSYSQNKDYDASRAYAEFQAAPEAEKAAAATELAEQFPGSAYHTFSLFHLAQNALAQNDLAAAEGYLEQVVAQADDELLVDLAKVRLAKIQVALDRSSQALETLASLSQDSYRAWGLEAKGDIHTARGEIQLAHAAYEAAIASLEEGESRPILEMKSKNVAPFEGEYVQFADTLEAALKDAQETIEQSAAELDSDANSSQENTDEATDAEEPSND